MNSNSTPQKPSFASIVASGTLDIVSSRSIKIIQPNIIKTTIETENNKRSSEFTSKQCSNLNSSSSSTSSTEACTESTSSSSLGNAPSFKLAPIPTKNPWKTDVIKKELSLVIQSQLELPTPTESKYIKPLPVELDCINYPYNLVEESRNHDPSLNGKNTVNTKLKDGKPIPPNSGIREKYPQKKSKHRIHLSDNSSDIKPITRLTDSRDKSEEHFNNTNVFDSRNDSMRSITKSRRNYHSKTDMIPISNRVKSVHSKQNSGRQKSKMSDNPDEVKKSPNSKNNKNKRSSFNNQKKVIAKKQPNRRGKSKKIKEMCIDSPTPKESHVLMKGAVQQVEYFFSTNELIRNVYLRRQMDVDGYLPAAIIFNFPTVLSYSIPYYDLLEALLQSDIIEVDLSNECLRLKGENAYKKWLVPNMDGTFGVTKWIKEDTKAAKDDNSNLNVDDGMLEFKDNTNQNPRNSMS